MKPVVVEAAIISIHMYSYAIGEWESKHTAPDSQPVALLNAIRILRCREALSPHIHRDLILIHPLQCVDKVGPGQGIDRGQVQAQRHTQRQHSGHKCHAQRSGSLGAGGGGGDTGGVRGSGDGVFLERCFTNVAVVCGGDEDEIAGTDAPRGVRTADNNAGQVTAIDPGERWEAEVECTMRR